MAAKVFFTPAQPRKGWKGLIRSMPALMDALEPARGIVPKDLVAIKLTFSEFGNSAYLRPQFVRPVVDALKALGAKPFLTDANTLYVGGRSNAVDHIETAVANGFAYAVVGAPVIIADGLTGRSSVTVQIDKEYLKTAKLAAVAHHADAIMSLAHVHGHVATGFAGTLKNVGMGFGCRAGKQSQHSQEEPPVVNVETCVGCGRCILYCSAEAIEIVDKKAHIDPEKCIRCGECTVTCPEHAIAIRWGDAEGGLQQRIAEYAWAVLRDKREKSFFFAFLIDVCPSCLCTSRSEPPIVQDIGVLASRDPVAIEQAAFDLVRDAPGIAESELGGPCEAGQDKFARLYPGVRAEATIEHAEKIGLGTREYELVEL